MTITLYQPITYGDTSNDLSRHARAGSQNISLPGSQSQPNQTLVGDAHGLLKHAHGGNDTLSSVAFGATTVIGDAIAIDNHSHGGDDHITATARGTATALGDSLTMDGHAHGGDDIVSVDTVNADAIAYGDAQTMTDHAQGGDDAVTGSSFRTDTQLYGDAETLSGWSGGGDDILTSLGSRLTQMYGDGVQLLDHSTGGNDRLVSGPGTDQMWGDAATVAQGAHTGSDIFVFSTPNGHDTIMDFEPGKDHIELDGYGFHAYADVTNIMQDTSGGTMISFDPNDSILVAGIHTLTASDFILA